MIVKIYFDETKKNCQIIKPTAKFNGDVKGLVETVTHSNLDKGIGFTKNFYSFDIL